jgi:negative regulator of flagellin synthesis FlgM
MKVTQSTNNSVQNAELQRKTQGTLTAKEVKAADAAKAEAAKKAAGTTIPDSVNASFSARSKDLAKDMETAKAVAAQTSDVREEKVAELKRRIAAGKYNLDTNAIADRMVDDHLEMRGT